jgi:prepilin-type N-terminal cleavage/methylation domain-containing protein
MAMGLTVSSAVTALCWVMFPLQTEEPEVPHILGEGLVLGASGPSGRERRLGMAVAPSRRRQVDSLLALCVGAMVGERLGVSESRTLGLFPRGIESCDREEKCNPTRYQWITNVARCLLIVKVVMKRPSPSAHQRGFSLIELLVVLTLIGAVILISAGMMSGTYKRFQLEATAMDIQEVLASAMDYTAKNRGDVFLRFEPVGDRWRLRITADRAGVSVLQEATLSRIYFNAIQLAGR